MTKTQESILWNYYQSLKKIQDYIPTDTDLLAWTDFLEKERTGAVPLDPLVQLREDVNATYKRVTDNEAFTAEFMTEVLDRLAKLESQQD